MKRLLTLQAAWLAVALTGCSKIDESPDGREVSSLRAAVNASLAPGTAVLWDVVPVEKPMSVESVTWSLPDGASLLVPFYRLFDEAPHVDRAIAAHIASDGKVTPLYPEEAESARLFSLTADTPPPTVIHCGDEALVRICEPEGSTVWVTDIARGTIRRSEAVFDSCKDMAMGPGLSARFATIRARPTTTTLSQWSCSGGKLEEISQAVPLPWMATMPIWFEEIDEGLFAWVRHQPGTGGGLDFGTWTYEQSNGEKKLEIPVQGLQLPSGFDLTKHWERVRREPSGALLVDGISGLFRWHIEGDGEVEKLGTVPPAEESGWKNVGFATAMSSKSEPNPEQETLEVPLSYSIHVPEGDGYRSMQVPTTPCVTRETCRWLGESYLRGVIDAASGPLGLYLLWTWQVAPMHAGVSSSNDYLAALVIAPLDRPQP